MPQLNYVKEGQGPMVVLSHALGCDLSMWDGVAQAMARRYTVLRYDQKQSDSKMVSSVTALGYIVMTILYHWPWGGWRHTAGRRRNGQTG